MLRFTYTIIVSLLTASAFAAGNVPSVNSDIGCTNTGDSVAYTGSTLGCGPPQRPTTVIGSLPTCNTAYRGRMFIVTDALVPVAIATVAAGGAVTIGVTCNGTNWIVQ